MNVIVLIATGRREWGDMSLNLALSIKANNPRQKIALIHTESAIAGLEPLIKLVFDFQYLVHRSDFTTAYEHAFCLKTELYNISVQMCPSATAFIYLDSDVIMIAGKDPAQWFEEHKDREFTSYCNDIYDYKTGLRSRPDYKFWCNPEEAAAYFGISETAKMPQINTSFIYFKPSPTVKEFFDLAIEVWKDEGFGAYEDYKGAKPDEFCFNVAAAKSGLLPHQTTYRPIFFRFASENTEEEYIQQYYKAFGFAGKMAYTQPLIDWYNRAVAYYRKGYGLRTMFEFSKETKNAKDDNQIKLKCKVRTLFREGEVENSNGGIFNPSGVISSQGTEIILFRKEKNMDVYKRKYSHNTAIPHLVYANGKDCEVNITGLPKDVRVEDFRLVPNSFLKNSPIPFENYLCTFSLIENNQQDSMTCKIGVARLGSAISFPFISTIELDRSVNKVEKNWSVICNGEDMYVIYSLSPYKVFKFNDDKKIFCELAIKEPNLRWFHHGQFICNSTHPVLIDGYYLMFFHTKENMVYYHGAVLINAETLEIEYYTKNSIELPLRNDGMHKGLHYVSGCAYVAATDSVRLYVGENDSHSVTVDFDKNELFTAIKKNKA